MTNSSSSHGSQDCPVLAGNDSCKKSNQAITEADVLITEALARRPARQPDLAAENQALRILVQQLMDEPQSILQNLVRLALDLCRAGTVGVSLWETTPDGESICRWVAIAGALEGLEQTTIPGNFSPCATTLGGMPQLYAHPESYFTYLHHPRWSIVEGLLIPLCVNHQPLGTLWILSHDQARRFDAEDQRLMTSLAGFTASALQSTAHLCQTAEAALEREQETCAEHKQVAAALHQSEEFNQQILNSSDDCIKVLDLSGLILYVNQGGQTLLGIQDLTPILNCPWVEFWQGVDRQAALKALEMAKAGGVGSLQGYCPTLAGEPKWWDVKITPIRGVEGQVKKLLCISRDITGRQRLELQLAGQNAVLEAIALGQSLEQILQVTTAAVEHQIPGALCWVLLANEDETTLSCVAAASFPAAYRVAMQNLPIADNVGSCGTAAFCRSRIVVDDIASDPRWVTLRELALEHEIRASWSQPIIASSGKLYGTFAASFHQPRRPEPEELAHLESAAQLVGIAVERTRAEAQLRESEEQYRTLFNSIDEGFCVIEMMLDATDNPVDYRFLEVNLTFEHQTGLVQAAGKTARELVPQLEPHWIEHYGKVALTGEPLRFVNHSEAMGYWFDVYAFRFGGQESRKVALLFNNITDRKRRELNTEFLANINADFALLTNTNEIMRTIGEKTSAYFGGARVSFSEINETAEQATVIYSRQEAGDSSIVGMTFRLADFMSTSFLGELKTGQTIAISDVITDPRTLSVAEAYQPYAVRSQIQSPYLRDGHWKFLLTVQQPEPYEWPTDAIELMHELAARLWLRLERARAEDALRESEERYRALADLSPDAILVNVDGRFTYANSAAARLLGAEQPSQIKGRSPFDFIDTQYHDIVRERLEQMRQRQAVKPLMEQRWRRIDGATIDVEVSAGATAWQGKPAIQVLLRDITDRKQAEAALHESEDRLRMAIESAQLGTWDWNLTTNELKWDVGCKAMFGVPSDAESSIEVFFAGLHPADRQRLQNVVEWALDPASGGSYDTEYRTVGLQDQIERWVAAKGQAYFNAEGKPLRFIGTVLDITNQKQAEAQREQLLQREQAAREAAERANRIKDEFLAVLSHELRSPLNPILGWSKLLQSRTFNQQQTKHALETIERNAKLQTQLIEDLLDVSRILQGKLILNQAAVNLGSTIEAALETVRLTAEAKKIQIQTVLDAQVGPILGDAARLQQVIWNLLSNAMKFAPSGGMVEIRLEQIETYAQIQVKDNGKGIKPEFLPSVFEYFRQEDGTTTRQFGGLGLGLAIVHHLVELHGGSVWAESPGEGLGATFTVRLPLMLVSTTTPQDNLQPAVMVHLGGLQILVVDDEPDMREVVSFILEQAGAVVRAAASGSEALNFIEQSLPDVLICDVGMPDMDGYMLMRQLRTRATEQGGQIPAIALTAYAGEVNQQQAIAAGFQRHLAKPVEPDELVGAIKTLGKEFADQGS